MSNTVKIQLIKRVDLHDDLTEDKPEYGFILEDDYEHYFCTFRSKEEFEQKLKAFGKEDFEQNLLCLVLSDSADSDTTQSLLNEAREHGIQLNDGWIEPEEFDTLYKECMEIIENETT